ncbi:MAG TPA: DCC1-like thiol-disulfide oxidoreductase family protein [Candidatus Saccharimonadales bacterium]|jgi:predicted DCC family thiol-disulfide oxidoreductase YuxK|nr:DCC1-like thiol-disulfide oxidoreductase family protein [Candidatus Saccharimonadales bacterium]
MDRLYLLYDERCELCRRLKNWVLRQDAWLELKVLPAGSEAAQRLFPGLQQIATGDDLVVIGDDGEVYLNNHAWIMCLYALREYRDWARRLSHPLLLPLARQAFDTLSKNRQGISQWLAGDPQRIADRLSRVTLEPCSIPKGTLSDYLR